MIEKFQKFIRSLVHAIKFQWYLYWKGIRNLRRMASPIYFTAGDTLQMNWDFSFDFLPEKYMPRDLELRKEFFKKMWKYENDLDHLLHEIAECYRILGGKKAMRFRAGKLSYKLITESRDKEFVLAQGLCEELKITEEIGRDPKLEIRFDRFMCVFYQELFQNIRQIGCHNEKLIKIVVEDRNEA